MIKFRTGDHWFNVVPVKPKDDLSPQISGLFPNQVSYMNDPQNSGDYHFFAAVDGEGTFLGGSVIDIGPMAFGPLADAITGFLENIEVLEPYRRKGIGSALLMAALDCAWERGAQHVRWTVEYNAAAAIGLYKSLGLAFIPEEDPSTAEPERRYTVVAVNPTAIKNGYAR